MNDLVVVDKRKKEFVSEKYKKLKKQRRMVSEVQPLRNAVIAALEDAGIKKEEIATLFRLNVDRVYKVLLDAKPYRELVDKYRENRADIMAFNQFLRDRIQLKALNCLTDEKLENASVREVVSVVDRVGVDKSREFENERLEVGKSSENVAITVKYINEMKDRMEE